MDEIYEQLQNLRLNLESFDGSKTFGFVTQEMEAEADKIRSEIRHLERKLNENHFS